MKIKKRNTITWMFFFSVIALENFCWLIPSDEYIVTGLLKFSDIGVIFAIFWSFYVFGSTRKNAYSKAMIWPALFYVCAFISCYMASRFFGQSMGLGIRQIRYFLVCVIYFYAIFRSLQSRLITKADVYKIIKFQAVFECVIFLLQYLLIDRVVFVHTGISFEYGNARLRVSYLLPMIQMYISLNEYLNGIKKTQNLICVFLGAIVLAGLCKHRAPTLIMLCTFCIALVLWKKKLSTKLIVSLLAIVVIVAFVSNSDMIQQAFGVLFKGSSEGDTLSIRKIGRMYYFEQLTNYNAWVTGLGQPNINSISAYKASGALNHIYLADNGIFGLLYAHGILGVAWIVCFFASIFKKSFYLFKEKKQYQYLLYFLFELGNLYMGLHWFYYYAAPFMIFMALLNWEYEEERYSKKVVTK